MPEPLDALRRRSMRESIGCDVTGRHPLQAIVADRSRRVQSLFDIARLELDAAAGRAPGLHCAVAPGTGVTISLQFDGTDESQNKL